MHVTIQDLLAVLYHASPTMVDALSRNRRRVEHGLLPVGLKLHLHASAAQNMMFLVNELGGKEAVLEFNLYRQNEASICFVLPPVGSARAAIMLLECIERYIVYPLFHNREVQIQICSPGRLDPRRTGLLTLGYILGSDYLKSLDLRRLSTTFSDHAGLPRGVRLAIYDGLGPLERDFEWWQQSRLRKDSILWSATKMFKKKLEVIQNRLPFKSERTDVLVGTSRRDIENVNLLATLLVHERYGWYWRDLGEKFYAEMSALLEEHHLEWRSVPWIYDGDRGSDNIEIRKVENLEFLSAVQEVSSYIFDEAERLRVGGGKGGILHQMQALLGKYRGLLVADAQKVEERRIAT